MSLRRAFPSGLRWKWFLVFLVTAACLFSIVRLPIRRGLDLQGGTLMVLQIQVQDAFKTEADMAMNRLRSALAESTIRFGSVERNDPQSVETAHTVRIHVTNVSPTQHTELRTLAESALGRDWIAANGETGVSFGMREEAAAALREETMTQSARTIGRRIDDLGIAETSVQRRSGDRMPSSRCC